MNFLPKILLLGLISSSGLGIVSPVSAETPAKIEPKALAILKQMSDRLSAARSLAFTATITYESPSRIGPPLVYTTIADVTLERPNKLRVISPGDGQANQFYYDGKTITAYLPTENLVAVTKAPNNLDAALKLAYTAVVGPRPERRPPRESPSAQRLPLPIKRNPTMRALRRAVPTPSERSILTSQGDAFITQLVQALITAAVRLG
jgi:hypothetical protein